MALTKREQILVALEAALQDTVGVTGRVYRSRVEPVSKNEGAALVIEPVKDTPAQNTSLPTLDWTFLVNFVVVIRSDVPDSAADPIFSSLHALLMADLTLGGLAIDVQPAPVDFNFVEADTPAGVFKCAYIIRYRTLVDTLNQ